MEFSDQLVRDLATSARPHSWLDRTYRKEVVFRRPLSFDRVNEGRPSQSSAQNFQLPVEILGEILHHIPSASLASLALVNRDCRQLARSRQFASVLLDYSYYSLDLVDLLYSEHEERLANNGSTLLPSLGSCIRAVTVATNSRNLSLNNGIMNRNLSGLKENVSKSDLEDAWDMYSRDYIGVLEILLSDCAVFPHLEVFDWNDTLTLPPFYYDTILRSSIQHLKLHNVSIDQEFGVKVSKALKTGGWPLRSLHLDISSSLAVSDKLRILPLCYSILQLCASTLESLTWESKTSQFNCDLDSIPSDLELPDFTNLRKLKLDRVEALDDSMLDALIQDNLRALEIDAGLTPIYTDFFHERGTIDSLETLVFKFHESDVERRYTYSFRNFLAENAQITTLRLERAISQFIEIGILPILSTSFFHLKSLSLAWTSRLLSEQTLELLGSLTSLEQMHLSTEERYIHIDEWRIDHERMRKHFCKLVLLKKLAFSDRLESCSVHTVWYYPSRRPIKNWPPEQKKRYEERHCEQMLGEARNYATAMTMLEWIYIGRLSIGVEDLPDKKGRNVVSLSGGKDEDYRDRLEDMFGWNRFSQGDGKETSSQACRFCKACRLCEARQFWLVGSVLSVQ
ncbi:hypothetical protein MMC14_004159 [Varicellaria rhodocarpa]|nr:hypothetical protein [Varicellaria rhodocarpa]